MGKLSVAACTFPFLYAHAGMAQQIAEIGHY